MGGGGGLPSSTLQNPNSEGTGEDFGHLKKKIVGEKWDLGSVRLLGETIKDFPRGQKVMKFNVGPYQK